MSNFWPTPTYTDCLINMVRLFSVTDLKLPSWSTWRPIAFPNWSPSPLSPLHYLQISTQGLIEWTQGPINLHHSVVLMPIGSLAREVEQWKPIIWKKSVFRAFCFLGWNWLCKSWALGTGWSLSPLFSHCLVTAPLTEHNPFLSH